MVNFQTSTINRLSQNHKERARYYRFMNNEQASLGEVISKSSDIDAGLVEGMDVFVPIDETNVSLSNYKPSKKLHSADSPALIGVSANNKTPGFRLFASLAIDEYSGNLIGLADIVHHCVPKSVASKAELKKQRIARRKLSFEHRDSYSWALAASNSHQQLSQANRVTYLMDRGGDTYEVLAHILDMDRAEVLVRTYVDRQGKDLGKGRSGLLSALLDACPWQDRREVKLRALDHYSKSSGTRKLRKARDTEFGIRFLTFEPSIPSSYTGNGQTIKRHLFVVEVLEDPAFVPKGEEPVHWRLLTSRPIETPEQAWQLIELYQQRWHIEQLFRVLKKLGLDIEASQFNDEQAIVKQAIMALAAASKVMQLRLAYTSEHAVPRETVFDLEEQQCLEAILPRLEGNTEKQQNPYNQNQLKWAAWVIARLGGWKGYASQRRPGPITFKRGLQKFQTIVWARTLWDDS